MFSSIDSFSATGVAYLISDLGIIIGSMEGLAVVESAIE